MSKGSFRRTRKPYMHFRMNRKTKHKIQLNDCETIECATHSLEQPMIVGLGGARNAGK